MPETIVDSITVVLPNLDEARMKSLVERLLLVVGVEEVSDLIFVKEDDINDILTPLQCRKLIDGFQRKGLFDFSFVVKYNRNYIKLPSLCLMYSPQYQLSYNHCYLNASSYLNAN